MLEVQERTGRGPDASLNLQTIVVAEDPLVSKLVHAVLRKRGYEDVTLVSATEAKVLMRSPESKVGVLITNSPRDFLEFADQVPVLYLSSMPDPRWLAAFRSCRAVRKPFLPEELVDAVDELAVNELAGPV